MQRAEMIQASIEAYEGDSGRMAGLIRSNLRDVDREHAVALAKLVSGEEVRVSLAIPGCSYNGTVVGATERYVVQASIGAPGEMVLHSRRALFNAEWLVPGHFAEIRYPDGAAGVVDVPVD
jgi:cell filamentation protein